MPSRFAGKISLAPAITANWLRIMAGVAVVAYGTVSAQAAEDNSTSEQTQSKWSIIIGGGGAYMPDYEGSDDYEFQPIPFASVVYDDFIFIRGPSLGVNLLNYEGFKAGPIARYSFGRDEDDNNALEGLGDVDDSIELGGFIKYEIGIWSADLTVTQDVAGGHEGLLAEASTGIAVPLTENLRSSIEASATWADSNYMETYFGVSSAQSAASGYSVYDADGGFKDVGVTLGLDYMFTDRIGIGGRAQYKLLLGDAADSPIVADEGSEDQFLSTLFLTYRFR